MTTAVFSGVPRWDTPQEALDYSLDLAETVPRDGWVLHMTGDVARWERHEGDHLVGVVEHQREGTGWGYGSPDVCGETRTPLR